jgi:hypothetical protein
VWLRLGWVGGGGVCIALWLALCTDGCGYGAPVPASASISVGSMALMPAVDSRLARPRGSRPRQEVRSMEGNYSRRSG